jgi:transcriptional regulator with XRE-family HTH domain
MDDLAERLKALREQRGLTQAELGVRAGMGAASVSHFETGRRAPALDSLVRLADALEVSTDALLGRETEKTNARIDPIFLRASRASSSTLDAIRKVTAALLATSETKK